jgi:hypothetical protein
MVYFGLFDEMQTDTLRKCVVFYTAISSERVSESFDFTKVDALTEREIKMRLAPMLRKKELFDLFVARERVKKYLTSLCEIDDNEKQFLSAFRSGKYKPELLFDGDLLERVRDHPMAAWKMQVHRQGKSATI